MRAVHYQRRLSTVRPKTRLRYVLNGFAVISAAWTPHPHLNFIPGTFLKVFVHIQDVFATECSSLWENCPRFSPMWRWQRTCKRQTPPKTWHCALPIAVGCEEAEGHDFACTLSKMVSKQLPSLVSIRGVGTNTLLVWISGVFRDFMGIYI